MKREAMLRTFKAAGGFALARRATARQLRILCYHGLSYEDEHLRHPKLFISPDRFAQRMDRLQALGATVLPLGDAVTRLQNDSLPELPVVITFDDGWRSVLDLAVPVLREKHYASTLYVTTSEIEARTPASNIVVESLFATAAPRIVDMSTFDPCLSGRFDLAITAERQKACDRLISEMYRRFPPAERVEWVTRCGEWLEIPQLVLKYNDLYQFASFEELASLRERDGGLMDIQLHSHSHRLKVDDKAAVQEEIMTNRALLESCTKAALEHFCYPSGVHHERMFPWLAEVGIKTATTCKPGFNDSRTQVHGLRRYLDGEHLSLLNFEAEVCGVLELVRAARGRLRHQHGVGPG